MGIDRTYNFHEIVGLHVQTNDGFAADYFDAEYGAARRSLTEGRPVVEFHWSHSSLPRRPGSNFHLKIHKGLARWYYRIHYEPQLILIEATGNKTALPMVHHMLLHGCLRYLCSTQGALLLHASALAYRDQGLIFSGEGGVGKTTVSSVVLDQGAPDWQLHADDYVFLNSAGVTSSYPSREHLYADLLKVIPELASRLDSRQRAHLSVFGTVRQLSGDRIKWPLRVEPSALWPERITAVQAILRALFLLETGRTHEIVLSQLSDLDELVDRLVEINFGEARHTIGLLEDTNVPHGYLEEWKSRERDILRKGLRGVPTFSMRIPRNESLNRAALVSELQQLVRAEPEHH